MFMFDLYNNVVFGASICTPLVYQTNDAVLLYIGIPWTKWIAVHHV